MTSLVIGAQIVAILMNVIIAFEDWRSREVGVLWLTGVSLAGIGLVVAQSKWIDPYWWAAVMIVLVLLAGIGLMSKLRSDPGQIIGGADIWMIGLLPLFLAPVELLWLIVGTCLGLIGIAGLAKLIPGWTFDTQRFPLAGGLAIGLLGILTWKLIEYGTS